MVASSTPLNRHSHQLLQQNFSVTFQYQVHFTEQLFDSNNPLLANVVAADSETLPHKMMVIADEGVLANHPHLSSQIENYCHHYGDVLKLTTAVIAVPGGEAIKNNSNWVEAWQQKMDESSLCRHSFVIAIGGGAVLDAVGYAAATAHRGIRLIRVPTTVLAQNDAGVGVKNGINAFAKKNFLGTFSPPYAVLNDSAFLHTLDDRNWRGGIAEAIKVSLIKDVAFFEQLETLAGAIALREMSAMQMAIYRSAELHLQHIARNGDPFEMGSSRPLDFGHWAAHRLEHLTHYRLNHGEAVAIGIALDSTYSYLMGLLPERELQRIYDTLQTLKFTLYVPELSNYLDDPQHPNSLFIGLKEFQEHLGGQLTVMLLAGIGRGVEVHQVNLERYREAVGILKNQSFTL